MIKYSVWFSAALVAGCAAKSDVGDNPGMRSATIPPTEVSTVVAEVRPFEYVIATSGTVRSSSEAEVQSQIQGIVKRVFARNNRSVKEGELLLELDNTTQKLHLEKALVTLKEKRLSFEDQMMGFNLNADSNRIQNARENVRISSGLAAAEISYAEARLNYDHTFVRAPIAGVVSDLVLTVGNPVAAKQVICRLHDPRRMNVQGFVLEEDAGRLKPGNKASVKPLGMSESSFEAHVSEINPRVDEKTRMVMVTLTLGKINSTLLPGMHTQVSIRVPYARNIIVPKEAIVIRSGRTVIFTVVDNLAKWNYVTTGSENGKEIEIPEGLQAGDSVIITNNLQLAHDAPVTVIARD